MHAQAFRYFKGEKMVIEAIDGQNDDIYRHMYALHRQMLAFILEADNKTNLHD
jgi:hypothetical protein